ncbi:hypothetical protein EDC01DRAFT_635331 [Geopyxis carbonaria]|nr:hypothetical protein EDC01DRAFT_635331 [Geopyxis carbonaria]
MRSHPEPVPELDDICEEQDHGQASSSLCEVSMPTAGAVSNNNVPDTEVGNVSVTNDNIQFLDHGINGNQMIMESVHPVSDPGHLPHELIGDLSLNLMKWLENYIGQIQGLL